MLKAICLSVVGFFMFCSLAMGDLVDNYDGTVTDTATGLMWQQDEAGVMTWEAALTYCEDLVLPAAGHDDWRLPNRNELQSIVDYEKFNPAIDKEKFPDVVSDAVYWSSTTYAPDSDGAWTVFLYEGFLLNWDKLNNCYVRAVRGGQ
jgi:hypothetical protein